MGGWIDGWIDGWVDGWMARLRVCRFSISSARCLGYCGLQGLSVGLFTIRQGAGSVHGGEQGGGGDLPVESSPVLFSFLLLLLLPLI